MSAISNVIAALRKAQGEYPNAEEMKEINQLVSGLHKDNDIKKANKNPIEELIGTFDAISLDIVIDKSNEFKDIFTIGVGDSPNDLGMLDEVNFPCLIKRKNNENILNKDKYTISTEEAPSGWMEVVKIGLEKNKLII